MAFPARWKAALVEGVRSHVTNWCRCDELEHLLFCFCFPNLPVDVCIESFGAPRNYALFKIIEMPAREELCLVLNDLALSKCPYLCITDYDCKLKYGFFKMFDCIAWHPTLGKLIYTHKGDVCAFDPSHPSCDFVLFQIDSLAVLPWVMILKDDDSIYIHNRWTRLLEKYSLTGDLLSTYAIPWPRESAVFLAVPHPVTKKTVIITEIGPATPAHMIFLDDSLTLVNEIKRSDDDARVLPELFGWDADSGCLLWAPPPSDKKSPDSEVLLESFGAISLGSIDVGMRYTFLLPCSLPSGQSVLYCLSRQHIRIIESSFPKQT